MVGDIAQWWRIRCASPTGTPLAGLLSCCSCLTRLQAARAEGRRFDSGYLRLTQFFFAAKFPRDAGSASGDLVESFPIVAALTFVTPGGALFVLSFSALCDHISFIITYSMLSFQSHAPRSIMYTTSLVVSPESYHSPRLLLTSRLTLSSNSGLRSRHIFAASMFAGDSSFGSAIMLMTDIKIFSTLCMGLQRSEADS